MFDTPVPWKVLSAHVGVGVLTDGWNLADTPDDPDDLSESRVFTVPVQFADSFSSSPVVHLGITGFDMDQRSSARVTLKAEQITRHGFTASIATWAGSRVHALEFQWFAIGA
jgi:hypothetical protein